MTYSWKLGAHISVNAQTAGAVCEQLAEGGRLTAKDLLNESRPEEAPLHGAFEWDDAVAAESFREAQARHIINCLVIQHEEVEPTRAFFNIRVESPNYEHIDAIIRSEDKREDLLHTALRELSAFKKKFHSLSELSLVIKAIDATEQKISGRNGMNKFIFSGNLTKDPETRSTQSGVSVCSFTVAVNSGFGENKNTAFYRVNAWRGLAENCQKYLAKGRKVLVSGELQPRAYKDKDGMERTSLDVNAEEVEFLSPREEAKKDPDGWEDISSSDIPF